MTIDPRKYWYIILVSASYRFYICLMNSGCPSSYRELFQRLNNLTNLIEHRTKRLMCAEQMTAQTVPHNKWTRSRLYARLSGSKINILRQRHLEITHLGPQLSDFLSTVPVNSNRNCRTVYKVLQILSVRGAKVWLICRTLLNKLVDWFPFDSLTSSVKCGKNK